MGVELAGAGLSLAGTGLSAYGQQQAIRALQDVWKKQQEQQSGYDGNLRTATSELIGGLSPDQVLGTATTQQLLPQLDHANQAMVSAAGKQAGLHRGGSRGGAEFRSQNQMGIDGTLADMLRSDQIAALLAGMQHGQFATDMLGRQFGITAHNIRTDANHMASTAPLFEKAAGMKGGWARQLGQLFQSVGQGTMNYGMSQPASPAAPKSVLEDMQYGVDKNITPDYFSTKNNALA